MVVSPKSVTDQKRKFNPPAVWPMPPQYTKSHEFGIRALIRLPSVQKLKVAFAALAAFVCRWILEPVPMQCVLSTFPGLEK